MPYQELKSLYYIDNETYAKEYLNRINSEESIRLDFKIGEHQAFFLQNAETFKLAYKVARLDKEISRLCALLPGVAIQQYLNKCLIDEIVITNKIEGVHSSRKEIGDVLDELETQSKKKGKHQRYKGLVNKYKRLTKNESISLRSCKDIRDIYDEVFLDEVIHEDSKNAPDGELFRKHSVSVHSETDKVIHTGLTPESKIIEAVTQSLNFLNDDSVEDLFRICIFHYLIEYIHPFYDGNGRLGRFILSYGISNVLSPLISFRISKTIKENINAYYKAFKTCNDYRNLGDLTPFLLMQLNMILMSMKDLKKSLEEKLSIWNKYKNEIRTYCDDKDLLRLYSFLIQAALFSEKGISMAELVKYMKASPYITKGILAQIPEELVVIKKKGNFKFYSLNLEKFDSIILEKSVQSITKTE